MTGKNQTYARQLNNQLIMRELRNGCCSATMLSQRLNLSNAALSGIIAQLLADGYIKQVDVQDTNSVGRKPIYYTVNESFGYIVVIAFSNYIANIVVSDMKMNVVESVEMAIDKYDIAMLYELVLVVKNIIAKPQYRDIPLLGIDFSVPGKVNTQTGELQLAPQFDKDIFSEKNAIVQLFSKQFGVPVMLTNDINLAGLGELYQGTLQGVEHGMLVDVDEGIGGAFILNGKLYTGEQGFGGEIGLMHANFGGVNDCIDEFVSLRAIKKELNKDRQKPNRLHTKELIELYGKDQAVTKHINATAECLGKVLKDVVELLNISTIVISGRVKGFGKPYLDIIQCQVNQSINSCNVQFSTLGNNASIIGAIHKAVQALTDDIFI